MSYTERDFKMAVQAVFDAYDSRKSGVLELDQLNQLINGALREMGSEMTLSTQEIKDYIQEVGRNQDGKIVKD